MSNGSTPSRTPARADPARPAFTVRTLAQAVAAARAAAEADRPIALLSAADAGIYAGPGWFTALIDAVRATVPSACLTSMLDCGGDAGATMAAIRAGVEAVVFTGRAEVAARLTEIAAARSCRLVTERPGAALDLAGLLLADGDILRRRCADALACFRAIC